MEKAISFPTSARLPAGGVIGFVHPDHAYHPYPASEHYANGLTASWRMNHPSIYAAPGTQMPSSLN